MVGTAFPERNCGLRLYWKLQKKTVLDLVHTRSVLLACQSNFLALS